MKAIRSSERPWILLALFILGTALFSARVAGQGESWQVIRADYGYNSLRTDVTDLLTDLISRGGVNGRVAVNNQTMGGDPAVGKDKTLRVFAKNRRGEQHEFDYREDSYLDATIFSVRRDDADDYRRDRDDGRGYPRYDRGDDYGGKYRQDFRGLAILWGFYGVQGKTIDVTGLLRRMVRDGALTVVVNNSSMGGDPAIGADKMLIVIYRYQGREQAVAIAEDSRLTIP
jgi:hypothetical protein